MLVGDTLNPVLDFLARNVWVPFTTEPLFARGFLWALGLVFVAGGIFALCRKFCNRISLFFKPTRLPATKDGPTPFSLLVGCLMPIIVLLVIFFNVLWFGYLRP